MTTHRTDRLPSWLILTVAVATLIAVAVLAYRDTIGLTDPPPPAPSSPSSPATTPTTPTVGEGAPQARVRTVRTRCWVVTYTETRPDPLASWEVTDVQRTRRAACR